MSLCACTCGREAGDKTFATPGCRERYEDRLAVAVQAAGAADRPDQALDALEVPTGNCRRVLAVLRRLGKATTAELCQPLVGGTGGVKRVHELKRLGFVIEKEFVRRGSYLYTLHSEPGLGTAVVPAVTPPPAAPERVDEPSGSRTQFGPYADYEDEAA